MKLFEINSRGITPGLPITAGRMDMYDYVHLGEKILRTSRPIREREAKATLDYNVRQTRVVDRFFDAELALGDRIEFVATSARNSKDIIVRLSEFTPGDIEFRVTAAAEVYIQATDKSFETGEVGATALIRLSEDGEVTVYATPKRGFLQWSVPQAVHVATLTYSKGEPEYKRADR